LQFPFDVRHCFKTSSLEFHFQFGKQIQHQSTVMILEIKVWSSLAFSHSFRHVYVPLLLIICQESGNKLSDSAAYVQIFC
jgi:hypothetical protein